MDDLNSATPHLFEPARHSPLCTTPWDDHQVRSYLEELGRQLQATCAAPGKQPLADAQFPYSIYEGFAGITWSLQQLHGRNYLATPPARLATLLEQAPGSLQAPHDLFAEFDVPVAHSFYLGKAGELLQLWAETRDPQLLDTLEELIAQNQSHPWMENLWGAPSTMLVAKHLLEATGQERFAALVRSGASYLYERLGEYPQARCRMWLIDLYGEESWLLGAGHGFVGNVFSIIQTLHLFDAREREQWLSLVRTTVERTAERADGLANWRQSIGRHRSGRDSMLVQQCHGAPGFVIGLSSLLGVAGEAFDTLLLEAGELTWAAGPLDKYPGLCHGTAGNGYAFLKLFAHTGDTLWLQRARAFAMSAIEQREAILGGGRAPEAGLWDGDAGLALYLADCIDAVAGFPTLDYF